MEVFAWPASNGRSHPISSSVPRNCRLCSCPIQQPPPLPCKQQPHEDPLCLTKDLKDSLNALQQAERSPPRQPSPDNRWLEEERPFLRGACWSAASNSMSCLQLSNSILQMTAASCGKTSSSSAPDEASSVRQLLLSGGSSSSSLGSSSAPDSGYGLPFCMDDDQLPSHDDEQAAVAPPEVSPCTLSPDFSMRISNQRTFLWGTAVLQWMAVKAFIVVRVAQRYSLVFL